MNRIALRRDCRRGRHLRSRYDLVCRHGGTRTSLQQHAGGSRSQDCSESRNRSARQTGRRSRRQHEKPADGTWELERLRDRFDDRRAIRPRTSAFLDRPDGCKSPHRGSSCNGCKRRARDAAAGNGSENVGSGGLGSRRISRTLRTASLRLPFLMRCVSGVCGRRLLFGRPFSPELFEKSSFLREPCV